MGMSIFTNASAMSATNALNQSNKMLTTSMKRLGTGKRINSASDDAAGLQIASRLQSQVDGMSVARKNIGDTTAMLQTADGGFNELTNIMGRMKDLATESANGTKTQRDRDALQAEFSDLNGELKNIMQNTSFGGEKLMADEVAAVSASGTSGTTGYVPPVDAQAAGKLTDVSGMTFQIGDSTGETLKVDVAADLGSLKKSLTTLATIDLSKGVGASAGVSPAPGIPGDFTLTAQGAMKELSSAMEKVGSVRAKLGASINRLGHTDANVATMQDNTRVALGAIRDVDYATEMSNMTRQQMLSQTSMTMLKQSNSMSQMIAGLMQQ